MSNKWTQWRECEEFRHIQSLCFNILKKNNKSFNSISSDKDSDYNKDYEYNFIAFASKSDYSGSAEIDGSSSVVSCHSRGVQTMVYESIDDDNLTENALIQSYKLMHAKWNEVTKVNERLTGQVVQSNIEKNNLQKTISDLEVKLKESKTSALTA